MTSSKLSKILSDLQVFKADAGALYGPPVGLPSTLFCVSGDTEPETTEITTQDGWWVGILPELNFNDKIMSQVLRTFLGTVVFHNANMKESVRCYDLKLDSPSGSLAFFALQTPQNKNTIADSRVFTQDCNMPNIMTPTRVMTVYEETGDAIIIKKMFLNATLSGALPGESLGEIVYQVMHTLSTVLNPKGKKELIFELGEDCDQNPVYFAKVLGPVRKAVELLNMKANRPVRVK